MGDLHTGMPLSDASELKLSLLSSLLDHDGESELGQRSPSVRLEVRSQTTIDKTPGAMVEQLFCRRQATARS